MVGGDVVDVLDEDHVPAQVVQVGQQRAVTAGAKNQAPVRVADRDAGAVDRHGVGVRPLRREGGLEAGIEVRFVPRAQRVEPGHEFRQVIGRDREVQAADAGGVARAGGRFYELLLERGPDHIAGPVKVEQTLWPRRVAEARFIEQAGDDPVVGAAGALGLGIQTGGRHGARQGREEGEPMQPVHELEGGACVAVALTGRARQRRPGQRRQTRPHAQQRLEHPGGGAGGRYELHAAPRAPGVRVRQTIACRQVRIDADDAVIEPARAGERDRRRRVAEETQLAGQRRVADAAAFEVGAVGWPQHPWFGPQGRHRGILQAARRNGRGRCRVKLHRGILQAARRNGRGRCRVN